MLPLNELIVRKEIKVGSLKKEFNEKLAFFDKKINDKADEDEINKIAVELEEMLTNFKILNIGIPSNVREVGFSEEE